MADTPRPGLALTALRYAAGELPATEAAVFDAQLAVDQAARDALEEAIRLSAAALGRPAPAPDPLARSAVLDRLRPTLISRAFPRRPYRGHPLTWAGLGGVMAAGLTALGVWLGDPPAAPVSARRPPARMIDATPAPRPVQFVEAAPAPRPAPAAPVVVADATPAPALAASQADVRPPAPTGKPAPEDETTPPAVEAPPDTPARTAADPSATAPRPARQPAEPSSFNPSLGPVEMDEPGAGSAG
ncbi:MAG: hypothetical protein U0871_26675 [Gemmataceae bacterium]